jgi:hypothetical protein
VQSSNYDQGTDILAHRGDDPPRFPHLLYPTKWPQCGMIPVVTADAYQIQSSSSVAQPRLTISRCSWVARLAAAKGKPPMRLKVRNSREEKALRCNISVVSGQRRGAGKKGPLWSPLCGILTTKRLEIKSIDIICIIMVESKRVT